MSFRILASELWLHTAVCRAGCHEQEGARVQSLNHLIIGKKSAIVKPQIRGGELMWK
jgi:hypothetical protein